jgi:hypothetical protein
MQVEEGAKSGIKNRCISGETKEWLGKCKIGMSDKSETARGRLERVWLHGENRSFVPSNLARSLDQRG